VKVELVKILTILELTGGRFSKLPWKIVSIVRSSMFVVGISNQFFNTFQEFSFSLLNPLKVERELRIAP
jgi:hypothetical protein